MSITAIHLYSTLDKSLDVNDPRTPTKFAELKLFSVSKSDHYIIKNVVGLDAEEILYNYSNQSVSGQDFYQINMKPRVITMSIFLNPKYDAGETVDSLRANLYKMISFSRNALINLRFMQGATHVYDLYGFITKFESSLFSSSPEVQITFECEDPMIKAPNYTNLVSSPYRSDTLTVVDNESTAAHGFVATINFPSEVTYFQIKSVAGYNVSDFTVTTPVAGTVTISSEYKNRYIKKGLISFTDITSVVSNVFWPLIYPGENVFEINTNLVVEDFTWEIFLHKKTLWGI